MHRKGDSMVVKLCIALFSLVTHDNKEKANKKGMKQKKKKKIEYATLLNFEGACGAPTALRARTKGLTAEAEGAIATLALNHDIFLFIENYRVATEKRALLRTEMMCSDATTNIAPFTVDTSMARADNMASMSKMMHNRFVANRAAL